jgi:hypothetical protein
MPTHFSGNRQKCQLDLQKYRSPTGAIVGIFPAVTRTGQLAPPATA